MIYLSKFRLIILLLFITAIIPVVSYSFTVVKNSDYGSKDSLVPIASQPLIDRVKSVLYKGSKKVSGAFGKVGKHFEDYSKSKHDEFRETSFVRNPLGKAASYTNTVLAKIPEGIAKTGQFVTDVDALKGLGTKYEEGSKKLFNYVIRTNNDSNQRYKDLVKFGKDKVIGVGKELYDDCANNDCVNSVGTVLGVVLIGKPRVSGKLLDVKDKSKKKNKHKEEDNTKFESQTKAPQIQELDPNKYIVSDSFESKMKSASDGVKKMNEFTASLLKGEKGGADTVVKALNKLRINNVREAIDTLTTIDKDAFKVIADQLPKGSKFMAQGGSQWYLSIWKMVLKRFQKLLIRNLNLMLTSLSQNLFYSQKQE